MVTNRFIVSVTRVIESKLTLVGSLSGVFCSIFLISEDYGATYVNYG